MEPQNLLRETETLADFIMTRCVGKSQILARYINLMNNQSFGNALVSDLGDYVPFFYWLGKLTENPVYMKWAENQVIMTVEKAQMPCGLFAFFDADIAGSLRKTDLRIFRPYDTDDAIVGIILMHELTRKPKYLDMAMNFFDGLSRFSLNKGFICTHTIPSIHLKSPLSMPNYCGVYIEEICRLCSLTQNETLLPFAEKVATAWLRTESFQKHGLFTFQSLSSTIKPFFINLLLKSRAGLTLNTALTSKPNTNLLFGLIALYEKTGDNSVKEAILRWLDSVEKTIKTDDVFYSLFDLKTEKADGISLEINHAVIDVLLEIYSKLHNKNAFDLAKKCADFWLKQQHACGLVPEGIHGKVILPFKKKSIYPLPANTSRLDSQVDFAVILAKLYDLTNQKDYLKASLKIVEGILKLHKFGGGYCEFVNLETLEKQGLIIETKFLTLLMKVLLLLYEIRQGASIYKNTLLTNLIRDR